MAEKIKLIVICGWGRSGSTILGSVLGELPGFFFGGEMRNLWNRVLLDNKICGCNKPIKECDFWTKVLKNGNIENVDPVEMNNLLMKYTRTRHTPLFLFPQAKKFFSEKLKDYLKNLESFLYSVKEVSGCKVIVDSSKSPTHAFILSLIPSIDLTVIHLIRDPRGVSYSRTKVKYHRPEEEMKRFNSAMSAFVWMIKNLSAEIMLKNKCNFIRIKYEDAIQNPHATIEKILKAADVKDIHIPISSDNEIELTPNHVMWGNPNRFNTGKVHLKLDEEWKQKMNAKDKFFSTAISFPLLKKYGYK